MFGIEQLLGRRGVAEPRLRWHAPDAGGADDPAAGRATPIDRRAVDLAALGRRRVVVVSDRYPPNTHGGAELSLHTALRARDLGAELLVVSFGGFDADVRDHQYTIDGIDVVELGADGAAAGAWSPPPPSADDRALARRAQDAPKPRGGLALDFVRYPADPRVPRLRAVLEATRPDVVHADNTRSILLAAEATRGLDVRTVGQVRDHRFRCPRHDQSARVGSRFCGTCDLACADEDAPRDPGLQRELLGRLRQYRRDALAGMDEVIVTSDFLRRGTATFIPEDRIRVVPNTVEDQATIRRAVEGVPQLPGTHVLVVGMLTENKGQIELVKRLPALVARVPDVTVHFAGRGDRIARRIREVADAHGMTHRVVLHGYLDREALFRLYRQVTVVALPTLWPEPFGRVPLEAAACGRPVAAFAVGGLVETIRDGETGRLVPPDDWDALFEGIAGASHLPLLFDITDAGTYSLPAQNSENAAPDASTDGPADESTERSRTNHLTIPSHEEILRRLDKIEALLGETVAVPNSRRSASVVGRSSDQWPAVSDAIKQLVSIVPMFTRRKLRKLIRNPRGFIRDSHLASWILHGDRWR